MRDGGQSGYKTVHNLWETIYYEYELRQVISVLGTISWAINEAGLPAHGITVGLK